MRVLFIIFSLIPFLIFSQVEQELESGNLTLNSVNKREFYVGALSNYSFGSTDYTLKARSEINNNLSDLKSHLVFPLDSYNVGAYFKMAKANNYNKKWSIQFTIVTNISNPTSSMVDKDWIDGVEVSSTKSSSDLRNLYTFVESDFQILTKTTYYLTAFANISYDKIDQEINGYSGWVKDEFGVIYDISGTERVINYNVSYLNSVVGLGLDWSVSERLNLNLKAGGGLSVAKDYDYHVLRNKEANGKGVGYNIYSSSNLSYSLDRRSSGKYKIGLNIMMNYIQVDGTQNMTSKNNGGGPFYETTLEGIPHKFDYLKSSFGLIFEMKL
ncbi:MAG: omptin family outer membrane protease [Flavobacteriaceae bacterium]|nr:omptin family outer membrane protease [Flavobacteriaceae bacterium]